MKLSGDVRITGIINDEEFSAAGEASGDASTGDYTVRLEYTHVPHGWHPLMYTDVKVSLLFLKEQDQGQNFLSLTGGHYTSAGTIDLGAGNILRNNTVINLTDKNHFTAVYVMHGTAHTGDLSTMEYFEETMLPFGPGRIAALGIARWKTKDGKPLDGLFSTRYMFDQKHRLNRPQMRRIEAKPSLREMTFASTYTSLVRALPRLVEEGGPYIGHLIS